MSIPSPCPNLQQLRQLLLGASPNDLADQLEQHLEECSRCAGLFSALEAEDARAAKPTGSWAERANRASASGETPPLDDGVCEILRKLVTVHGRTITRLPVLCRTLLKDECPQYFREVEALLAAVRANVVERLPLTVPESVWDEASEPLVEELVNRGVLDAETARWALEAWDFALEDAGAEQVLATPVVSARVRRPATPPRWSLRLEFGFASAVAAALGAFVRFRTLDAGMPEALPDQLRLGAAVGAALGAALFAIFCSGSGKASCGEPIGWVNTISKLLFFFGGSAASVFLFTIILCTNTPEWRVEKNHFVWIHGQAVCAFAGAFFAGCWGRAVFRD